MVKQSEPKEGVSLYYRIESTEFIWLKNNISKYLSAYDSMIASGALVDAWITTSHGEPNIYFNVRGNSESIEDALDILFSTECGLPYAVLKPGLHGKVFGKTSQGFRIAEKVISKYGKTLRTKFDGGLVQKIVS